jgi:stearoyl-CoA desaturase (delta-9 desaturase)
VSGFYHAHIGWFLNDTRWKQVPATNPVYRAFGAAPELRWLDRWYWLPPLMWAAGMAAVGGWPWLAWGFCLPTVTLAHATFAINTVNHLWGSRRFRTHDDSTNNPLTAFFAVGEGWHNNHHRYQRAARNGFYWWEFDPTFYVIKLMEAAGLAWNLQPVPPRVYAEAAQARHGAPGRGDRARRGQGEVTAPAAPSESAGAPPGWPATGRR